MHYLHILGNQIKTISLQTSYDSKLTTATYDAVKAFQVNTLNDSTSDATTSKMRDIEASVETFYNSVSENFQISKGDKSSIKNYVPALVYTMYDGFYIYSPFYNIVNPTEDENFKIKEGSTYEDGEKLYGLKPYIYYSCRYKPNNNSDFVITYSLDNYITIQGKVNGKDWDISGYLIDGITKLGNGDISYNGIKIPKINTISEYVNKESGGRQLKYIQENGTKYYLDESNIFSIISGQKKYVNTETLKKDYENKINNNNSAYNYYNLAYEFTNTINNNNTLKNLKFSDAVTEDGKNISDYYNNSLSEEQKQKNSYLSTFSNQTKIFGDNKNNIEESDSNFNEHRTAVIRYAIQKNLSVAITNFNDYSNSNNEFQMPELSETDWYSIINNISMISFLQGMPIGGRMYNGYSVVVNNKNKEVVSEESIYITTNDNQYHRVNSAHLISDYSNYKNGIYNINFERRSFIDEDTLQTKYYFPQEDTGCYSCIVNSSGVKDENMDILKYVKNLATSKEEKAQKIAELYYIALGRERYGMNRTSYETYANNLQNGNWKYCNLTQ